MEVKYTLLFVSRTSFFSSFLCFQKIELENPMLLLIVASVGLGLNLFAMILFAGSGGHGHSHGGSNVAESDHSISGSSHSHSHNGKESSSHGHSHASPTPHSHSSPSPLPTSARDDQTSPPPTLRQESSSAAILEASAPKRKSNLAMYSVFLHVLGDALGSIAVIASALFIWLTDFSWRFYVDPVISILLSVILIVGSSNLVRKTVLVLMQSTPLSVDTPKIAESISKIKGVLDIHDLHVWQLDETRTVASVHVVCRARSKWKRIAGEIQTIFHAVDVHAVTIQPEFEDLAIEDERSMSFTSLEGEDLSDKVVIKSSGVVETNVVRCRNACLSGECSEQRCCD